jgi:hypothetical protein
MLDAVTPEDIAAIAKALIARAREGDVGAARLVLGYVVGRPQPAEDPDRLDEKEWEQWRREVTPHGQLIEVLQTTTAGMACTIAGATMPSIQADRAQAIHESVLAYDDEDDEEDFDDEEPAQQAPVPPAHAEQTPAVPKKDATVDQGPLLELLRQIVAARALLAEKGEGALAPLLKLDEPTVTRRVQPDRRAANPPGT